MNSLTANVRPLVHESLFNSCYNLTYYDPGTSDGGSVWTAYKAMKPAERQAFIGKLVKDRRLADDLHYATIIEKRKDEPTISLDDYLARRVAKK